MLAITLVLVAESLGFKRIINYWIIYQQIYAKHDYILESISISINYPRSQFTKHLHYLAELWSLKNLWHLWHKL